jgi:hypothetical protein
MFDEFDGQEFIYKEPTVTHLSEIVIRLETMLTKRYAKVVVIRDAAKEATANLDSNIPHLQVTYVTPYFSESEKAHRRNNFERNHDISRFVYDVPLGRATVAERTIERVILTVEDSITFPFVKKRLDKLLGYVSMVSSSLVHYES